MNKSAIKGFSVRARRKLIVDITQKAYALGIKDKGKYDEIEEFEGGFRVKSAVNQLIYPMSVKKDREKLIAEINRKGFEQVVEEVAYTWFNRIIAIRFMEINEYLPVKVRMLSSEIEGKTEPDVLTNIYNYVTELELDKEKVFELKENHKDEDLFKYVFVKECNNLGKLMPQVFEAIGDYTELLLPDQLLSSGSVIRDLVESIEEEDFKNEVEIIGWMYQYYISEKKDEVFAALKKNKKITKENIPAATQLFTPKWIVKYMTENSLGRLWQKSHPDEALKQKWEYYIEPAKQEVEVQKKLDELKNPNLSPEEIKILDPAMGSGHILVYAFDVLYDIYLSRGYAERDIPQLILEKNLYGLDIDDRATQLASFALLMKGRSKNRRFFRQAVDLNICSIQESNSFSKEALEYIVSPNETDIEKITHLKDAKYLIDVFRDAKDYGSIIDVSIIDSKALYDRVNEINDGHNLNMFEYGHRNEIINLIPDLIKQAKIMSMKYDVVLSNPPYLNFRSMNNKLVQYCVEQYPESKSDLFAIFIEKSLKLCKTERYCSLITMQNWMYLDSFESFRKKILKQNHFVNFLHFGMKAFDQGDVGTIVKTAAFVISKGVSESVESTFVDLREEQSSVKKQNKVLKLATTGFVDSNSVYRINPRNFLKISHCPFSYAFSHKIIQLFENEKFIKSYGKALCGIQTGNNNLFLKLWHEVDLTNTALDCYNYDEYLQSGKKWAPQVKGGLYRKWYGNFDYVINMQNGGFDIANAKSTNFRLRDSENYLIEGLTWSHTSDRFGVRFLPAGNFHNVEAPTLFLNSFEEKYKIIAFLNTNIVEWILAQLDDSLHFSVTDIANLPYIDVEIDVDKVKENIEISKEDWDSFETSWNFKRNPLINSKSTLIESFNDWENICVKRYSIVKNNEEYLNLTFIKAFDLEGKMDYKVTDKNITIYRANLQSDIKNFISYSVGCMFGRYSLDVEGLVYAGGEFDESKYIKLGASNDNVLLISEDDYFENDIAYKFIEFVRIAFGGETLEENIKFIASVLNQKSKGTPRQTIRNYFIKDFYKDHCKMYKNRPIYWLIDSGKQNAIKALFYMHRYDKSTIARFRTDYLHEIQRYYENDIELTEKSNDKKKVDYLKKKLQEVTEFDKVVAHIAHQQIEFDLDDGVDYNYELFQGVEVPQGDGQKPMKADLLAKRK